MRRFLAGPLLALSLAFMGLGSAQADTPAPVGANDWNCRPGSFLKPQPRPVVLVHGTFENMFDNWGYMAPQLAAKGFCVYAFNYGENAYSAGLIYGLGPVEDSARQLRDFVERVRASTGASKVDIVGHSQGGGLMPRWYLKFLGGASRVNHLVGIAPSNHGTDLLGLLALADAFPAFAPYTQQIRQGGEAVAGTFAPAAVQQLKGSSLLNTLNAGGDTQAGVKYTVIASRYDEVVTPYASQFLVGSGVTNILLQDVCPLDPSEHIMMPYDPIVIDLVSKALGSRFGFDPVALSCGALKRR